MAPHVAEYLAHGVRLALDKTSSVADLYRLWIPRVGPLLALAVFFGVIGAVLAKYRIWRDFLTVDSKAHWGIRTYITVIGLIPDLAMPVIFALVWVVLA
jgi:hypothetical protein